MLNKFFGKSVKKSDSEDLSKLYSLIREVLDKEHQDTELTPKTNLEHIGFNSIKFIQLFLSLQDLVKVDLEEMVEEIDLPKIKTIQDISDLLANLNK